MSSEETLQTQNTIPTEAQERPIPVGSQNLTLTSREIIAGGLAGIGGGFTMGLVAMMVSLTHGLGLWAPFNDVAGVPFPGIIAAGGRSSINPETVIVGVLIHFTISVLLAMLFAAIYSGLLKLTFDFGVPITMGLAYSWIIWMVVRFGFLPLLKSGVYEVPAFIIAHGVYGVTLGILYPILRKWAPLERRPPARRTARA